MKFNKHIIFLIILVSCTENTKTIIKDKSLVDDKRYQKLSKLNEKQLTKIQYQSTINLDTISTDEKNIDLIISNEGNISLKNFYIKPYCTCIQLPKYDSIMKAKTKQTISFKIPINNIGNFYFPIIIYGNFYPGMRTIYVEGYRKK